MGYLSFKELFDLPPEITGQLAHARMSVYAAGSDNLSQLFSDSELTLMRANPVVADETGNFPICHLMDGPCRIEITTRRGKVLAVEDGVPVRSRIFSDVKRSFRRVDLMLADETLSYSGGPGGLRVVPGDIVHATESNQGYRVLDAADPGHDMLTAGGVKLRVLPGNDGRVSVLAFGAAGDGVTDDTQAIQCALASNANELVLPQGTYLCGALTIDAPIIVSGTGKLSMTGSLDVRANTTLKHEGGFEFEGAHCVIVSASGLALRCIGLTFHRLSGDYRAIHIAGEAPQLDVVRCLFTAANTSAHGTNGEAIYFGIDSAEGASFNIRNNKFKGYVSAFRTGAATSTYFSLETDSYFLGNRVAGCSGRGATFYHTSECRIADNIWKDCQYGVFIDACEAFEHNKVIGTKAVPSTLPPSDGTAIDITNPTDAANFRDYNGQASGDFLGGLLIYNGVRSCHDNKIIGNAWDGLIVSVNTFKDAAGLIEGNEILENGRHGVFVSPLPRGDSWSASKRRIYAPTISGGKIAANGGHAVCVDGRFVQEDGAVSYEQVLSVFLRDVETLENGAPGWHDEDGVAASILKAHRVAGNAVLGIKGVRYDKVVQGVNNTTVHGLYIIDDGDGAPSTGGEAIVEGCLLRKLSGFVLRETTGAGHRSVTGTMVKDVTTALSLPAATSGSLHVDIRDGNGQTLTYAQQP